MSHQLPFNTYGSETRWIYFNTANKKQAYVQNADSKVASGEKRGLPIWQKVI